jgi:hypothetical protein
MSQTNRPTHRHKSLACADQERTKSQIGVRFLQGGY